MRIGQVGGRPTGEGGGSSGSSTAHSASVQAISLRETPRSLAQRRPSRLCCARVALVHMGLFIQLGLNNLLETHPARVIHPRCTDVQRRTLSDIRLYRDALSHGLEQDQSIEVAGTSCLDDGIELVRRVGPDVVVLGATGPDSVVTTRSLREAAPKTSIVVVTAARDEFEFLAWAETGIGGYADRNSSAADLAAAVRHAARGEVLCSPRVVALLAGRIAKLSAERSKTSQLDSLTPRERDVLALVAQGLSNKHIAQHLRISETTTKNYVHNILDKLELKSRGLAAAYYRHVQPHAKTGTCPFEYQ